MIELPEPSFAERDPAKITADLVAKYEELTKKPLYPGQYERLFIELLAYNTTLNRIALQEACKQQLVRFARYPMLDLLGEFLGVERLGPQCATAMIRFRLDKPQAKDVLIPAGFKLQANGSAVFATTASVIIQRGQMEAQGEAKATDTGSAFNGYQPMELKCVQPPEAPLKVWTTTTTSGGCAAESDDHLRGRILEAPETFAAAGTAPGYRNHAMSVSPDIVDVGIANNILLPDVFTGPGMVGVFPLLSGGRLPDQALLDKVAAKLNDERIKALCDRIVVKAPTEVKFIIKAQVWAYKGFDPLTVKQAVEAGAAAYAASRQAKLGRDLVEGQLTAALFVEGVYKLKLEGWTETRLNMNQVAKCGSIEISIAGIEDEP